jgi:hypothetical protein
MPALEPYRDPQLPERFGRWIEVLRQRFRPIPTFSQGAGSPEGIVSGEIADEYYDLTDRVKYIKSTATGNTGWLLQGAGGTFQGFGMWRYRTATGPTPTTGQLQFDNAVIGSATNLYDHKTNDGGTDMSAFLNLLATGNLIYLQLQADASQFVNIVIGVPALAANVYTLPITTIVGQGTTPQNNARIAFVRA